QQPNVRYVGPILDDPSWAGTSWTPPWPADNHDPIVLVGLSSTYQDQQAALRNVVAALAPLRVRALVTLGPSLSADAVTSPAPHIVIVPTAPHGLVFPHCAAAITHCGHGTTIRALAAGVPLVCMPMGRDQNDTAVRVVARGAGVRVKPTAAVPAIRRAIERVLQEPRYAAGARALRDALAREAREVDPVALLEELAPAAAQGVSRAS
ncbi:MAG TPA: nucleotide disphospho-sugar-binding domain-containing protein, partial [Kofleriaceae bacterium]|nr:nucleotide disphospho-sugar-binding domain-containing protein [Kofleriaceae bacterium]